jgi:hypothetical protein
MIGTILADGTVILASSIKELGQVLAGTREA